MSRGDEYDDRSDRQDGYDDSGEPRRPDVRERVRVRVMIPGIFLILIGALSLGLSGYGLVGLATNPEEAMKPGYEMMVQFNKNNPGAVPPFDEYVKQYAPMAVGMSAVMVLGSLLILLGGIAMCRLRGYGLAMTGSITAAIGLCSMNCFCLSLPFGIWAIIVLINSDVKAAFRAPAVSDVA
jgi:hypothetical protein